MIFVTWRFANDKVKINMANAKVKITIPEYLGRFLI